MSYSTNEVSGNGVAGGIKSSPATRNTVSSLVVDFDPVLKRACAYASRLQNIRDRVVGGSPQTGEETRPDAISDCLMSAVHSRRATLIEILDRMESAINTLDESI